MSQAALRSTTAPGPALPGLPRVNLTPEQQLEALQRVQAQAEQRVKLGVTLFKAAEAHTSQYRKVLDELKAEQQEFRKEIQSDVARTLHGYDQWMGDMEKDVATSLKSLEDRIDKLQSEWSQTQARIEQVLKRSGAAVEQGRAMVTEATPAEAPRASVSEPELTAEAPIDASPIEAASDTGPNFPAFYSDILAKLYDKKS